MVKLPTENSLLFDYLKHFDIPEYRDPDYTDPAQRLADYLNCDFALVDKVAERYPDPDEQSPEAFEDYKVSVLNLRKVGNASSELAATMVLPGVQTYNLEARLGVSVERVKDFSRHCYQEEEDLNFELKRMPRKGGKRRDALIVATIVHDVFVALGREISAQHVSGQPVSDYGSAVQHALFLWKIRSDWRRPSEAAIKGERVYSVRNPFIPSGA